MVPLAEKHHLRPKVETGVYAESQQILRNFLTLVSNKSQQTLNNKTETNKTEQSQKFVM